ncbi:putative ferritin-1 [Posidoniimonas polymericola]|uniref:Ferritin n=1 Tax=Posidoniimonas polymericola TaxID=2528002 RepID=A0A5C5ZDK6_9BACT|nr:ferritin [Posidoniimonas polymericola]TWT85240.1 putative ferritin-1 [Posidoniimonas polymericola]
MKELSPVMQDAINDQIKNELSSSYSYLAMSAYLEHEQFLGCAAWMRAQSAEENDHAMRLYDFLTARGSRVVLQALAEPRKDYESIPQVFEAALEQERTVTSQIDNLFELAIEQKAFAALVELEWFVKEQVEEEKSLRDIVHKFNLVKDDPSSLLDLDRELGSRGPEPNAAAE